MKNLIKISLAFIFLPCLLAGCANAQTVDLSTKEAILEQLGKLKNQDLPNADNICIKRQKELSKIIVIGNHANDRDCRIDGAFINSLYLEATDANFSKAALAALGWKNSNRAQREQLAKLWVEKGLLAFFTVVDEKNEDFANREFQSPQISTTKNGEIVVTLWVSYVTRRKEYSRLKQKFAKDGNDSGSTTLEHFVPIRR